MSEPSLDVLINSPAGCGKTEALALRTQGLVRSGLIASSKKILIVTFSNRAKDNIKERVAKHLTPSEVRDRITVSTFHGLAARIFRAHSNVIGLESSMILPDGDWIGEQSRKIGLDFATARTVATSLRLAKQEPRTDSEVRALLRGIALDFEELRLEENRLTFDDLPRVAELILRNSQVAALYQSHFGAVVVDEYQDMTPQQLRLVNSFGLGRTTFAGDLAQGIYSFAGAEPSLIESLVKTQCTVRFEMKESHRSSPAVLALINAMTSLTGGSSLNAADADSWPGGGLAGRNIFDDAENEADYIVGLSKVILELAPKLRIGVMSRTTSRRRFVDQAFEVSPIEFHRWDDGVLDTETARIMKSMLSSFDTSLFISSQNKMDFLIQCTSVESIIDPQVRECVRDALNWSYDLLLSGLTASEIKARIRVGDSMTLLTVPGVHLLNGHTGKGQQFDWVFVLGLEDGSIPNFNAKTSLEMEEEARILAVMISRARHGVVLSDATYVKTLSGISRNYVSSRFYSLFESIHLRDASEVNEWISEVDWSAIQNR